MGCVNSALVKGKIVLCDEFRGNFEAHAAGAVGSILLNEKFENFSAVVSLPASALSNDNYDFVRSYVNSTKYV